MEDDTLHRDTVRYLAFLEIYLAIVGSIMGFKTLRIASPYAVTGYPSAFRRNSRCANLRGIVAAAEVLLNRWGVRPRLLREPTR